MSYRAAILISCLKDEADYIREQARADGRSISNYMLKVLLRWVESEERLYMDLSGYGQERSFARQVLLPKGPRTVILLRCSAEEGERIRRAAGRRAMQISKYIRWCFARTRAARDSQFSRLAPD